MKTIKTLALITLSLLISSSTTKNVEGVDFKESISIEGHELVLNGAGLREKYWLDLYVMGIYLNSKTNQAEEIIKQNRVKAIRIQIVSGLITSEKFINAVDDGLQKSVGDERMKIEKEIADFKEIFRNDPIVENDNFYLTHIPGKGLKVEKNGEYKTTIENEFFSQALFGIWLCDDPADDDLKKELLGLE